MVCKFQISVIKGTATSALPSCGPSWQGRPKQPVQSQHGEHQQTAPTRQSCEWAPWRQILQPQPSLRWRPSSPTLLSQATPRETDVKYVHCCLKALSLGIIHYVTILSNNMLLLRIHILSTTGSKNSLGFTLWFVHRLTTFQIFLLNTVRNDYFFNYLI